MCALLLKNLLSFPSGSVQQVSWAY